MYSTKTAITMSLKDLLSMLDDESIYTYYLGSIKIGKLINSPLRNDDRNPSFAIFRGKQGGLFFKDHGTGDGGNALKFVKLIKGIETREEFERVQAIKENNSFLKGKNTDYTWRKHSPLQGFARCPTCNHILGLTQSKFKRPDGSMRIHKYFHCRICKCNNVEHKNSRVDKLEEQVLSLIKEKYGEVEVKLKEKISIKDIEKKIEKLQAKKMSDFEKYKLGKMTKVKFVESKNQIDNEISKLEEKIKLSSNETEVVTDNELTRELMEKYVESVICEGSIVQKIIWK